MNAIKAREPWRPTAPMVLASDVERVFAERVTSPYMSFAAPLRPEMKREAPAIWHGDGTARPQTVTAAQEPWLHALLTAVKRETGLGLLVNTSFNTRGHPMINRADRALCALCGLADRGLDAVVVEDFLFRKEGACAACRWAEREGRPGVCAGAGGAGCSECLSLLDTSSREKWAKACRACRRRTRGCECWCPGHEGAETMHALGPEVFRLHLEHGFEVLDLDDPHFKVVEGLDLDDPHFKVVEGLAAETHGGRLLHKDL
jgi:hypothetical protein